MMGVPLVLGLFILLNTFSSFVYADLTPRRQVFAIRDEIDKSSQIEQMRALAVRVDQALDGIVRLAIDRLYEEGGHDKEADQFKFEWSAKWKGYLTRSTEKATSVYDIENQKPLIEWLDRFYTTVELMLGVDTCVTLRLSDIRSFNNGIIPTFNSCTFPVTEGETRRGEYLEIFNQGKIYRGTASATVYWVINLTCSFASTGVGALACAPIAMAAEWFFKRTIGPRLADKIIDKCNPT